MRERGIDFFCGVPDSLLSDPVASIIDRAAEGRHIIAANEGNAIALAAGHYLATGQVGLVYMQNSGLGNALNPLLSLTDGLVYRIPVLLLIGWRGEPGVKDEPQHLKQGAVTLPLLDTIGIGYSLLPSEQADLTETLTGACSYLQKKGEPYALVVRKGTFKAYQGQREQRESYTLMRENALAVVLSCLQKKDVLVATTGKLSRELYFMREEQQAGHRRDFLNVGSMGHASQIALGIALAKPERGVYCLDGDGAVLMHMGALAIIGNSAAKNFRHIVFNNGAHESVGGQPTVGFGVDFCGLASACGYRKVLRVEREDELKARMQELAAAEGPAFLEIRVKQGARETLGRPQKTPQQNKQELMAFLQE